MLMVGVRHMVFSCVDVGVGVLGVWVCWGGGGGGGGVL